MRAKSGLYKICLELQRGQEILINKESVNRSKRKLGEFVENKPKKWQECKTSIIIRYMYIGNTVIYGVEDYMYLWYVST